MGNSPQDARRVGARWIARRARRSLNLAEWGLEGLTEGRPVTLYHGTTQSFQKFDLGKSRDALVNDFYGPGIFLTPSRRVAEDYADANRNIGLDPSVIGDLAARNSGTGALLKSMFHHGHEAGWEEWMAANNLTTGDEIDAFMGDLDPNIMTDIAGYVIGSKVKPPGADDPSMNIFSMATGAPEWLYDSLEEVGLNADKYRPKVYTVVVKVQNPLVTTSQAAARKARSKGYDCVIYYGPELVAGVPEVAVFDPRNTKITGREVIDD